MTNVQPIETKIPSFNEETLFWIFYSCTQDIKQQLAAVELYALFITPKVAPANNLVGTAETGVGTRSCISG